MLSQGKIRDREHHRFQSRGFRDPYATYSKGVWERICEAVKHVTCEPWEDANCFPVSHRVVSFFPVFLLSLSGGLVCCPVAGYARGRLVATYVLTNALVLKTYADAPPMAGRMSVMPVAGRLRRAGNTFMLGDGASVNIVSTRLVPTTRCLTSVLSDTANCSLGMGRNRKAVALTLKSIRKGRNTCALATRDSGIGVANGSCKNIVTNVRSLERLFPPRVRSGRVIGNAS